ncbi:hypothetical protein K466DRAFT_607052, partial [Polyporus arcularius HHB13444]
MHPWSPSYIGSHPELREGDKILKRPLTPAMEQARHYADTGRVCIGPIGAPVSGKDRQLLLVIQEVVPLVMNNWFEGSYGARFYTSKLHIGQDPSLSM